MEFFDEVILSNTVRAYGIEAGIIILALLIKRYLSRYLASLLYRSFKKVWGNIEKQQFIDLVVQPLQLSVLLLIIVLSLDKLNFPEALNVSVYHITMQTLFERVGIGLIILSFTWVTLRLVDFIALVLEQKANLTEDQSDNQLIVFFKDFLKVFLVITGLLFILKFCFSQAIGPLIAGLGIAGAAIALAAKESLENIIASFIIFFDKPFTTGDIVKVQHVEGVIEHIRTKEYTYSHYRDFAGDRTQ
jgi:MscS family membrane protein